MGLKPSLQGAADEGLIGERARTAALSHAPLMSGKYASPDFPVVMPTL